MFSRVKVGKEYQTRDPLVVSVKILGDNGDVPYTYKGQVTYKTGQVFWRRYTKSGKCRRTKNKNNHLLVGFFERLIYRFFGK